MFLRGDEPIRKHGRDLPHWQQGEAMQFVTFRLADSLPQPKLEAWRDERGTWMEFHPKPWTSAQEAEYHRKFTSRIEKWLDQGHGSCLLNKKANREVVESVLMRFQGERVNHESWVIMPNHVHLLFASPLELEGLIKAWKGTSANKIRQGSIWQKRYRDTLVRDTEHFRNLVRYIRRNPAGLRPHEFTLWEGPRAKAVPTIPE